MARMAIPNVVKGRQGSKKMSFFWISYRTCTKTTVTELDKQFFHADFNWNSFTMLHGLSPFQRLHSNTKKWYSVKTVVDNVIDHCCWFHERNNSVHFTNKIVSIEIFAFHLCCLEVLLAVPLITTTYKVQTVKFS